MSRLKLLFVALFVSCLALGTVGGASRYIEELVIGGGTSDVDGGAWFDKQGNADFSGSVDVGTLTGSVSDAALSANIPRLNDALTITANWLNTAYPWADNEVADNLTISGGTIDNTPVAATTLTTTGTATIALDLTLTAGGLRLSNGYSVLNYGHAIYESGNSSRHQFQVGSGANGVPTVDLYGRNSANTTVRIGSIFTSWTASTAGAEVGLMSFALMGATTPGSTAFSEMVLSNTGLSLVRDLTVNGGDIKTTSGNLTIQPAGGSLTLAAATTANSLAVNSTVFGTDVPATPTSTGTTGQIKFDTGYIYVCTATNTWKRVAIATW